MWNPPLWVPVPVATELTSLWVKLFSYLFLMPVFDFHHGITSWYIQKLFRHVTKSSKNYRNFHNSYNRNRTVSHLYDFLLWFLLELSFSLVSCFIMPYLYIVLRTILKSVEYLVYLIGDGIYPNQLAICAIYQKSLRGAAHVNSPPPPCVVGFSLPQPRKCYKLNYRLLNYSVADF